LTVHDPTLMLRDNQNRVRVFHGMNVVYKAVPYVPRTDSFDFQYSFSQEDAQILQQYGMTAIRLGVMWPGVEPVRGQYNMTYLALMQDIVAMCENHSISVLIEMHQDDFSEKFCGEGVPLWAAQPANNSNFPEPLAPGFPKHGVPSPQNCSQIGWPNYYFTTAQCTAVQALYDNQDGLLDSWAAYWGMLAHTFANFSNIIGYELINEPWAGDVIKDPLLLIPGVADQKNLAKAYEPLAAAIRTHDPQRPVFFEGVTWDDVLVGFEQVPGGPEWRNKSVYAYHWYQPPNLDADSSIEAHHREATRLACGWFCTEV
ncbi:uncharacterized protein MONBRDRAFT_1029, partial [Monosiga brevicollis MX1]